MKVKVEQHERSIVILVAAGTTAIAGILHLLLVPNIIGFNVIMLYSFYYQE